MNTLFETRTDAEMRRDAVAENEARIHAALLGRGPWELSERQRRVLEALRGRQGVLLAMPIPELEARLQIKPREIKQIVRDLVMTFRLPIVASRDSEDGGYFFAVTAQERFTYTEQYIQEGKKLFQRAAVIRNEFDVNRLLGQKGIDLGDVDTRRGDGA